MASCNWIGSICRCVGVSLAAALATTVFADELPYYNSADFTPHWFASAADVPTDFHEIPAFQFANQFGATVTDQDVAGKVYVASFFFSTCPGICPAIRSKLSRVQERFAGDDGVRILAHSIRPETDSVAVLQAYADDNAIDGRFWHLLTGDRNTLHALARSAYFANEDLGEEQSEKDFLHTENLLLIDANRRIRGVYNGLSRSSVEHLINDIVVLRRNTPTTTLAVDAE
ncbi:MAG: SCO family protein [Pseudomonadota bacterium]